MKEIGISILLLIIIIVAILLPIVPAKIAYKLSPDKPISAEGIFSGFTVKAGGAFGAYLVILIILLPFLHLLAETVSSYLKPAWTVTIPIVIHNKAGKEAYLDPEVFKSIEVSQSPSSNSGGSKNIQFDVVGDAESWPHTVWVKIPPNYVGMIKLRGNEKISMDSISKTVYVDDILILRDEAPAQFQNTYTGGN